jgi:hypothetical protein
MADGLNNFFQSFSGALGNTLGNPSGINLQIPGGGLVRQPFLQPQNLLSSVYINYGGVSRTSGNSISKSPGVSLPETRKTGTLSPDPISGGFIYTPDIILQQPGFTPIEYYKTPTGEFKIVPPQNSKSYEERVSDFEKAPSLIGDDRTTDFRFKLADYVSVISQKNLLETADGGTSQKPWERGDIMKNKFENLGEDSRSDNEDPVYFGFEVIINVQSSPLFNGEAERFIDNIGKSYDEVLARKDILASFQSEFFKYFKFDSALGVSGGRTAAYQASTNNFGSLQSGQIRPGNKRYYVKKLAGLEKLVEANTGSSLKSFIDYGKDIITITFYEDTSLNLGRLASLYKLLYWSRLRGKSIIPENLLRFDCEIIVSELRNFAKVRKSNNMLEVLKSNLSRYRYQLYECQLWFNKMSHPSDIDMSNQLVMTDIYDVEMTFKYSTMVYEQYEGTDLKLRNSTVDPLVRAQTEIPVGNLEGNREYIRPSILEESPKDLKLFEYSAVNTGNEVDQTTAEDQTIQNLKQREKNNIYQLLSNPGASSTNTLPKNDIFGKAAEQLVENLKDAALRETQRQLNIRFSLLNNSLDRIRNSFGIGRIPAPSNVYFPQQNSGPYGNSNVFFDVQNSLRNFAGDALTGLLGGG